MIYAPRDWCLQATTTDITPLSSAINDIWAAPADPDR